MAIMKKPAVKTEEVKTAPTAKPTPKFEDVNDDAAVTETATTEATATASVKVDDAIAKSAEVQAAKTTAVAARPTGAVAVQRNIVSPFESMRSAFHVDYDTLLQFQANQGNIMTKADKKSLGDAITMELMSFQSNFVIAPGEDGDEAAKLVKYSDDGKTTKDGLDCKGYLKELLDAGYLDAKLSERVVLVGVLLSSVKQKELEGTLFQIDMPPSSKKPFDRYQLQAAYDTSKGRYTADEAKIIQLTCRVESGTIKGQTRDWTVVDFTRGTVSA